MSSWNDGSETPECACADASELWQVFLMCELKYTKPTILCNSEEHQFHHAFLLDLDQSVCSEMGGDIQTCFV